MARPTTRRSPRLETLEARKLLSADVTGEQQLMLELINEALISPETAAERVEQGLTRGAINAISRDGDSVEGVIAEIANAEARPPVAWDPSLAEAAKQHTEYQIRLGSQTHVGPRGLESATDRVIAAGYGRPDAVAENIIYGVDSSEHAMRAFLADYGPGNAHDPHRVNIQQPDSSKESLQDVGVAVLPVQVPIETASPFGSPSSPKTETKLIVTQVFGRKDDAAPKLLGVVYDDSNNDRFYDVGEGVAGATVTITNSSTGATSTVRTWSSGGYQAEVAPGLNRIEVRLNDRVIGRQEAVVGTENTKVDFRVNDAPRSATPAPTPTRTTTAPTTTPVRTPDAPAPRPQVVTSSPGTPATPPAKPRPAEAGPAAPPTLPTSAIDPTSTPQQSTGAPVRGSTGAKAEPRQSPREQRPSPARPAPSEAIDASSAMALLRSSLVGTIRSWRLAEGGAEPAMSSR